MIEKRVVFVTGAGASVPYGFPLGYKLVTELFAANIDQDLYVPLRDLGYRRDDIVGFRDDLLLSARTSIDAFLETNPKYLRLGKAVIALLLSR